jgi:hypothetical protein
MEFDVNVVVASDNEIYIEKGESTTFNYIFRFYSYNVEKQTEKELFVY